MNPLGLPAYSRCPPDLAPFTWPEIHYRKAIPESHSQVPTKPNKEPRTQLNHFFLSMTATPMSHHTTNMTASAAPEITPPIPHPESSTKQQVSNPPETSPTRPPALLHRSFTELPHKVIRASGNTLHLSNGRRILDACGGAAVAIIGHGNAEVIQSTTEQMHRVSYVHTMSYTTSSSEELAQCILKPFGASTFDHGLTKAFFVGSGSEANDAAMKCARQYWFEKGEVKRRVYVARKKAYHGNTLGAMSVSSILPRKVPYDDVLLPNVAFVSAADAYHGLVGKETEREYVGRLVDELEDEFLRLGPENVVSFIGETVSGAAMGAMPAPKGYWQAVRALCTKYNILLHLDEVMCGMGRMGTYFAFEQEGIQPDIVTIGKGLGGGYAPIAGMLINDKIVSGLRQGSSTFNHGQTYQAHPVSCATALAVQKIVKREGLVARSAAIGKKLERMLSEAFEGCEYVGDIRGGGTFWGIEFVKDRETRLPFSKVGLGSAIQLQAFELGVAVYPGSGTADGVLGDHVLLAPPYTATEEELQMAVDVLKQAYEMAVVQYAEEELELRYKMKL
ncbi:aminotransferase class 3 [Massarina eburnea CBS 473.64]|uniref:Aminotransferase class 3 n=1 Tax=Massarina eburnea CBS 473.64 TaxID=1395130 RepID=A0A6A6SG31_9PLEO|nr:aminotransferase class 3 [Massarina eburnea CBS 473.64]